MTRIVVFTPTCRMGGLDVAIAALKRQALPPATSLLWVVLDSCGVDRSEVLQTHARGLLWAYHKLPSPTDGQSNLCRACNMAVRAAREFGADMLVSLHDYTWIPSTGLARFVESVGPRSLTAGVCHHAKGPSADSVADRNGLYTIFAEPFTGKPEGIGWEDCRHRPGQGTTAADTIHWEPPFAAIGKECLYDERLYFDEGFDKAFRYENQDYAFRAKSLGYQVYVDHCNEAIQLPHWDYFPKDYADHNVGQEQNRQVIKERWGG